MEEAIRQVARARGITRQDAAQTLMQVLVLKHIALKEAVLIGGTALVLGDNNPRFSEDVDLAGIDNPLQLQRGLQRAQNEIGKILNTEVVLTTPKSPGKTWRLKAPLNPSTTLRLHIDTQPYPTRTRRPIVLRYPSLSSFIFPAATTEEIMADKIIALAFRRYLGGRDLFDLWFHWLEKELAISKKEIIREHVLWKLKQRSLSKELFFNQLSKRLQVKPALARAEQEWERYLTAPFRKPEVYDAMVAAAQCLPELFYDLV